MSEINRLCFGSVGLGRVRFRAAGAETPRPVTPFGTPTKADRSGTWCRSCAWFRTATESRQNFRMCTSEAFLIGRGIGRPARGDIPEGLRTYVSGPTKDGLSTTIPSIVQ
jgi:hypothetical protein